MTDNMITNISYNVKHSTVVKKLHYYIILDTKLIKNLDSQKPVN